MFRKMLREKQALNNDECIEILKTGLRGVLSVNGDEGYPYGVPINHFYNEADGKIYFHSGKKGHKIDAIKENRKASFCVIDGGTENENEWWLTFKSVIVFGRIEIVEDPETIIEISRLLSLKFTQDEAYIADEIEKYAKNTFMFALVPEHISGKRVNER